MKTVHLSVPDDLHAWLKAASAGEKRSIRNMLIKMIEDKKKEYENG